MAASCCLCMSVSPASPKSIHTLRHPDETPFNICYCVFCLRMFCIVYCIVLYCLSKISVRFSPSSFFFFFSWKGGGGGGVRGRGGCFVCFDLVSDSWHFILFFWKQKRQKSCPDCRVKVVHFGPTLEGQGQGQGAG